MRALVGGIGYRNLRDYSFGVLVSDALAARSWPAEVRIEDVSYNPIALVQRLEDEPPDRRFDLVVLVSAAERAGRAPGTLEIYRWDGALPGAERIQAAVADAVTGVIDLDNTLIVARHFRALPTLVVIVEAEPEIHAFGDELSPPVAGAFTRACEIVGRLAVDPTQAIHIAEAPLGGGRACPTPGSYVARISDDSPRAR